MKTMQYEIITTEAEVFGEISNNRGVTGTVTVDVRGESLDANETVDKLTPAGEISGTVEFPSQFGLLQRYRFSSSSPSYVTVISDDLDFAHVEARFKNATLENVLTNSTTTNCTVFFTGTLVKPNIWLGLYRINCPDGRYLVIYGYFSGDITIGQVA